MERCRQCGDEHPAGAALCPRTQRSVLEGPCGSRLDRYEVERLLASGGMGSVYRARHALLNRPVALKLLRAELALDADVVARFVQEARAASQINAPEIAQPLDFGVSPEGTPFLAMELLEGRDLEAVIQDEGPLAPARAVALARAVLTGLAAAHRAGVVHRDIKPGNVFVLGGRGAPETVKLLDFGISKVRAQGAALSTTRAGVAMGTPHYMAPEQFRSARDVDARADVYSVAVLLYQMLSRALPHEAGSYEELVVRVCTEAPRPFARVAPHAPPALAAAIDRGLASEPAARWQSAEEFSRALDEALRESSAASRAQALGVAGTMPALHSVAPASSTAPPFVAQGTAPPQRETARPGPYGAPYSPATGAPWSSAAFAPSGPGAPHARPPSAPPPGLAPPGPGVAAPHRARRPSLYWLLVPAGLVGAGLAAVGGLVGAGVFDGATEPSGVAASAPAPSVNAPLANAPAPPPPATAPPSASSSVVSPSAPPAGANPSSELAADLAEAAQLLRALQVPVGAFGNPVAPAETDEPPPDSSHVVVHEVVGSLDSTGLQRWLEAQLPRVADCAPMGGFAHFRVLPGGGERWLFAAIDLGSEAALARCVRLRMQSLGGRPSVGTGVATVEVALAAR